MDLYLHAGHTFPVPVPVADNFLGLASHDQLKVLLYVLCHAGETLNAEQIAKACKVLPAAVEEAVVFWQNANVLANTAEPVSVRIAETQSTPAPQPAAVQPSAPVQTAKPVTVTKAAAPETVSVPRLQASSSNLNIRPSEIASRIRNNPMIAEMFRSAEQLLKRPVTPTEQKSLIWMNEYLGLAPDVLLMLAAYCIRTDCFNPRYIEQIAVEWQERGITSHAKAEADIRRRIESRTYTGRIMKLFEMQRRPTTAQQAFIDEWQAAKMPLELISLAYEITRNQKDDKLSWNYLNGIIKRWAEAGVRTVADAEREDAAFRAAKEQKKQGKVRNVPAAAAGQQTHSSIDMDDVAKLINQFS